MQTDVGLSDPEMQTLREIAADCESKVEPLDRILMRLTFDSLMESIQFGQNASSPLQQRRQELYDQIDLVVHDHVAQLKTALGDSRFEKLDAFVRTQEPNRLSIRHQRPIDHPTNLLPASSPQVSSGRQWAWAVMEEDRTRPPFVKPVCPFRAATD